MLCILCSTKSTKRHTRILKSIVYRVPKSDEILMFVFKKIPNKGVMPQSLITFVVRVVDQLTDCTVVAKSFRTAGVFPLNPIVNKSCKIECCGNKMHQIVQNMILT